ncbi:MAG: phosphoglycerate kinase [Methanobacteriota archaeon]|nr:MAG: phosphoglycerate kinase [Euryarchaeota archaeon]
MTNSKPNGADSQSDLDEEEAAAPSSGSPLEFLTLDDFDIKGRRVLLRIDINSPIGEENLRIEDGSKIASAAPTVRELLDRGGRLVILAHQGRPGDYDFITLNEHADYLSSCTNSKIRYINDIYGDRAVRAIQALGDGEGILLQNIRNCPTEQLKLSPEEHAESEMITTLSPLFSLFVNDAFASSHRSHASLVGFTYTLPSAAGRLMEREFRALSELIQNPARPSTFIFGGTKFADALPVIERLAETDHVDNILISGLAGFAFQMILGNGVGKGTEGMAQKGITEDIRKAAKSLMKRHGTKLLLPVDGAIDEDGRRSEYALGDIPSDASILDVGTKTIEEFTRVILQSKTILLSGPPGVYEIEEFSKGTREIFAAIASANAYSVIGGGHSGAAANKFGMADKFSYLSTGGGAIERMILGKPMPVVEALKASAGNTYP